MYVYIQKCIMYTTVLHIPPYNMKLYDWQGSVVIDIEYMPDGGTKLQYTCIYMYRYCAI